MSKYLYNGIELPALPEWDKTTYPYAILYLKSSGLYMFSVCNKPFSYGTIEGFSFVGVWAEYNNAYKIYRVSEDLTQFELLNENENNGGYYSPCETSHGDMLIWTNTDILNADGSVYLAASVPVPVGELAWQKHDAYKPNTKWDGNTFYRVMGGKWVKQDAMLSAEKPAPIPANCLTFSSVEPFTISVNNEEKNWDGTLYYSNDAATWSEWTGVTSITSAAHGREQRIYLRGSGNTKITGIYSNTNRWVLTGDNVSCHGNIENLLDYEMVSNGVHPPMAEACYYALFSSWSGLIKAPDLGAIIMTPSCYRDMFDSCTNLVTAPELPATTLEDRCYYSMFRNCKNIKVAPRLPATNLYIGCYLHMFANCIGLTIPPELPAENLEERCYSSMFANCTGLVALPKLKATNLKFRCYASMFWGCTSIKLSETQTGEYQTPYRIPTSGTGVMADNALEYMFEGTGGTFVGEADIESAGTPKINKTYYTSNTVVPNAKEPIAYRYNGVQLPDINEVWTDKVTYPCAMITRTITDGTCLLHVCGDMPYYTEQAHSTEGYEPTVIAPKPYKAFAHVDGSWVLNTEETDYSFSIRTGSFELIWTNVDVMNKDNGSVYFDASEPPVPVYA